MSNNREASVYFDETQPVGRFWIRLLLLFEVIFFSAIVYRQVFMGKPFGPRPVTNTGLVALSLLLTLPTVVLFLLKIRILVNSNEIQYKMVPWGIFSHHIAKQKLQKFSVETKNAGRSRPVQGLSLQLKGGRTLFLPTKKPQLFYEAVQKMKAGEQ